MRAPRLRCSALGWLLRERPISSVGARRCVPAEWFPVHLSSYECQFVVLQLRQSLWGPKPFLFDFALYWAEQVGVTPRFVTGNDFFLTMGGVNTSADYFCGFGRQIGIDPPVAACPDETYDAAIVTPEPATVLLLATGILSLGGRSLVRRRQRRDAR